MLLNARLGCFTNMHFGAHHKNMSSSVTCTVAMALVFTMEVFADNVFSLHYRYRKKLFKQFLQSYRVKICCCFFFKNIDQTCFSDKLTSAGPLGSLSGLGFNTSLRAKQMLMHIKPCLIPIMILCAKIFSIWIFLQKNSMEGRSLFSRKIFIIESLNILSKMLEIYIQCQERLTWGQNFWIKPIFADIQFDGYLPCPLKLFFFFFFFFGI